MRENDPKYLADMAAYFTSQGYDVKGEAEAVYVYPREQHGTCGEGTCDFDAAWLEVWLYTQEPPEPFVFDFEKFAKGELAKPGPTHHEYMMGNFELGDFMRFVYAKAEAA